jgi:beta-galactosidase
MTSLNHPSGIMYSIGNEIIEVGSPEGDEISEKLHSLCKRLDPTRPTTNCVNLMLVGLGSGVFPQEKTATTPEDVVDPYREEPDARASGSLFVNIMVTVVPMLGEVFGRLKKVARVSQPCFDTVDVAGYNYGEAAYRKHHRWYPDRVMVSSETFPRRIAGNWRRVEAMPFLIGDFMWTGWDYLGEAGVGVPLYGQRLGGFTKPYPCISAGCGSVDLTGFVDAQGVYAAVVWGQYGQPYIGVRPVNHTGEKVFFGQWRGTDAVNSWSWTGMAGRKAEIEVYSIGAAVELLQDGTSLGKRKLTACKATFKTTYRPGELVAISTDAQGREIARSALKTAAEETVLSVLPEETVIRADGQDLAYIAVHVTDPAGITKMLDERTITVEVEGAGMLAAVGSGNPRTEEAFTGSSFTSYQGRMIAIVRSTGEPGEIRVRVSAPGLASREVTLEAQ